MDPLKQQQLAMPTVEVFLSIEEQLLINIAKQLKKHRSLMNENDIVSWQTEQLSMLGQLTQQQIIAIAKHSGLAVDEVTKALQQAGYATVEEYEGDLQEAVAMGLLIAPPSLEASQALQDVLTSYQQQALDTFNMINTTMLQQSQQVYLDIINQTVGKVLAGTVSPQQALRDSISKWAEKGIPALIKSNGHRMYTEGYLNMVMRSTVNNIANDMQDARMNDFGVDLLEVSSHMGARPGCAPFQGRIYSRSGTHPKYPAFATTSYGNPAGLFGVNCRHVKYPFIEGFSKRTYKPYSEEKNRQAYEESQQQRHLEREIRKAKRELGMMQAMGDDVAIKEASKKVKDAQADMREFIEATGRTRNRAREQLY
jgi:hypothetical protein